MLLVQYIVNSMTQIYIFSQFYLTREIISVGDTNQRYIYQVVTIHWSLNQLNDIPGIIYSSVVSPYRSLRPKGVILKRSEYSILDSILRSFQYKFCKLVLASAKTIRNTFTQSQYVGLFSLTPVLINCSR